MLQGHTALFTTAGQMLSELAALDSDPALRRRLQHFAAPDLLLIDEVGYLSYSNRHADMRLFVQHGARYCFPATRGPQTRGVPTGYAALPLSELIRAPAGEPPPVWPDKDGTVRGETLYPLYSTAPQGARRNPALHELPALLDAIRAGSPRERALALQLMDQRWTPAESAPATTAG